MRVSTTSPVPERVLHAQHANELIILRRPFILFLGIVFVSWVASPVVMLIYLLLALHAFRGSRETIEAFTILALILLGHPAFFSGGDKNFRWLILAVGLGRIIWDWVVLGGGLRLPRGVINLLGLFFISTLVASFTVSYIPSLSILKLVSFAIGVFVIFVCFYNTHHLNQYWQSWFYTFIVFSFVAGLLVYLAGLGYFRTREGFQGIWGHPQIMGPICSMMTAWLAGQYLSKRSTSKLLPLVTIIGVVFVFTSGARTAALALGGGLCIALIVLAVRKRSSISWQRLFINPLTGVVTVLLVVAMVLFSSEVKMMVSDFIQKGDDESSNVTEVFQESRGRRMNTSMDNFKSSPLLGIGFGIPSELTVSAHGVETVMGITTSASSEKGFMPSAILEEVGLVGALLVFLLMIAISLPIHRYADLSVVWMYWASLLVNAGAAILFSVGGLGFFMWLVIGYC